MADRTSADRRMTRPELSAYLEDLRTQFEGEGEVTIPVGNKAVQLSPPEEIDCEVTVEERSSRLRGDRQTVDIELSWKS